MSIEVIGFTLDTLGKIMVAYTAIRVHRRFWKEHKIDERVFQEMKSEQTIGIVGIIFIVAGYFLEIQSRI